MSWITGTGESIWLAMISGFGGVLAYLFGAWEGIIIALVFAVAIDYITGVVAAGMTGKLSSKAGFSGLLKKAGIFLVVALSGILDNAMPGTNGALRQATCIFYIMNESLSIIENAGEMGLPIPKALRRAVETLKDRDENENENENENEKENE